MQKWKITCAEGITEVTNLTTDKLAALIGPEFLLLSSLIYGVTIKTPDQETGEEVYSAISSHIGQLTSGFKSFGSDSNKKNFIIRFNSKAAREEFKTNLQKVRNEAQEYLDNESEAEETETDGTETETENSGVDVTSIILIALLVVLVAILIFKK